LSNKRLYERGYNKQDVLMLFRFIDWLMTLPPTLKQKFEETVIKYEEEQKVTFITSIEELGIEKGVKQGVEQGIQQGTLQKAKEDIIEVLKIRFIEVPDRLLEAINALNDVEVLKTLLRQAVTVEAIEPFEQSLAELSTDISPQKQA